MKKYPCIGQKNKNTTKDSNSYLWKEGCCVCKKPFKEEERFTRVDIETWYMRGDDDVFCYHNDCEPQGDLIKELYKTSTEQHD